MQVSFLLLGVITQALRKKNSTMEEFKNKFPDFYGDFIDISSRKIDDQDLDTSPSEEGEDDKEIIEISKFLGISEDAIFYSMSFSLNHKVFHSPRRAPAPEKERLEELLQKITKYTLEIVDFTEDEKREIEKEIEELYK